jgi:hypothetical protein
MVCIALVATTLYPITRGTHDGTLRQLRLLREGKGEPELKAEG